MRGSQAFPGSLQPTCNCRRKQCLTSKGSAVPAPPARTALPPRTRAGKKASPEGLWTTKIVDFGLSKVVVQQRQRALQHMLARNASKEALATSSAAGLRQERLSSAGEADLSAAANGREAAPESGEVPRSGRMAEFWSGKLGLVQRSGGSGSSAVQRTPSATTVGAGAVSNLSAVDAPAHGTGTSQQEGHSAR